MKIALLTNTINKPGGAEYVTLSMFKALLSFGNIDIYGREKLDPKLLQLWVDEPILNELIKHYHHLPKFPQNLNILMKYDLVINTRSNEVLAPAHVHYLHWIFSPWGVKDPETL